MPITTPTDFEAFYGRTVIDLTAFVRRRTHAMQVEDVLAETYAIAWRRRTDIPTTVGGSAAHDSHDPARAWLFTVARHQMMSTARGGRRRSDLSVRLASEATLSAPDPATSVTERDTFRRAWAVLSAREQEVLSLNLLEDLDNAAAARLLGCTRAAYSMRLSRARSHLTRALAHHPSRGAPEQRPEPAPVPRAESMHPHHPSTSSETA